MPAINGSIPEAPGGGHSSQAGTVLDAVAGDAADDDAPALVVDVVVTGEAVDDDAPALVGAVNVVTAADVEVEGVAVIAGKLTTPPGVRLVPATPAVVAAVCAVAGPASAIRRTIVMRNSWAMACPISYLTLGGGDNHNFARRLRRLTKEELPLPAPLASHCRKQDIEVALLNPIGNHQCLYYRVSEQLR